MSLAKKLLTLAAPAALLALGGCATGLPTQVSRFQAMPAPAGQTFAIQAADPEDRGGLEFSRYAELVRRHMIAQGYSEASSPQQASLIVSLGYGVDDGRQQVVSRPALGYSRFGYDRYGYGDELDVYTVYTSYLDMDIRRPDGQAVFEGTARARSRTDELGVLVPNLIEAMFTGFPGNSGETVKITVAPERRR